MLLKSNRLKLREQSIVLEKWDFERVISLQALSFPESVREPARRLRLWTLPWTWIPAGGSLCNNFLMKTKKVTEAAIP